MKLAALMAETPVASMALPVVRRADTFILASSTWQAQMRTTDRLIRKDGGERGDGSGKGGKMEHHRF